MVTGSDVVCEECCRISQEAVFMSHFVWSDRGVQARLRNIFSLRWRFINTKLCVLCVGSLWRMSVGWRGSRALKMYV